jgi:uncharacterized hydantoinase/oxoprolinase family protein
MGDVYLWLKRLEETEYIWPTPDGRPATRQYAGERLARAVCADHDLLDDSAIDEIAGALSCTQQQMITSRLSVIRGRYPSIDTAVITGLGAFIAAEAAQAAGLAVLPLSRQLDASPQTTPATAVASLLRASLTAGR